MLTLSYLLISSALLSRTSVPFSPFPVAFHFISFPLLFFLSFHAHTLIFILLFLTPALRFFCPFVYALVSVARSFSYSPLPPTPHALLSLLILFSNDFFSHLLFIFAYFSSSQFLSRSQLAPSHPSIVSAPDLRFANFLTSFTIRALPQPTRQPQIRRSKKRPNGAIYPR
jgi:hypothetical protein